MLYFFAAYFLHPMFQCLLYHPIHIRDLHHIGINGKRKWNPLESFSGFSFERETRTTLAKRSARSLAVARPMPDEAQVTTTILF
jgi:hypothetical protein